MKKTLIFLLRAFGSLLALAVLGIAVLSVSGKTRHDQRFDSIEIRTVRIPTSPQAMQVGEKWAQTLCTNCHAPDLSGRLLIEDNTIGMISSPNLTSGAGGIAAAYTVQNWVGALRHGISPDNTPLLGMPSDAFYYLNDEDLGALIAHIQSIPAVDHPISPTKLTPLAYVLISLGALGNIFPAEHIPHDQIPAYPAPAVSADYGQYLTRVSDCDNCHGRNLSGGESPVPGSPPGPNLTPGGTVAFWNTNQFINTMRSGKTPYGRQLDPDYMPWKEYNNLSDQELSAILIYLQSLPALEYGQ